MTKRLLQRLISNSSTLVAPCKIRIFSFGVIPAEAGISCIFKPLARRDAGLRRHDSQKWEALYNCDTVSEAGILSFQLVLYSGLAGSDVLEDFCDSIGIS
jgi:hypothetical protein